MAYDPFASVQRGIDFTQGIFDRGANLASGRAAAQGNYGAAANAQFANGNIPAGAALQDRGSTLDAEARTRRTADGAVALGVYKQITDALEGELPNGPQAVTAAFARLRPVLEQTGATPEQLNAYGQMLQQDPAGAIRTVRGAIGQAEWEFRDGGGGDVAAVRQGPGGTIESRLAYDAPDRPIATPYGIILPPNARPAGSSVGAAPVATGGSPAMTGSSISNSPLWSRQEQQESGGRQSAVSPVGAFGVAQLMPETAAEMARQMGVSPEALRTDENLNRQAGQRYMEQQLQKYGGNEVLALAAYNAGPGRVDEWIQSIGDPRTGEITTEEFAAQIPFAETRNYVRNITGGNFGGGQPQAQGSDQGQELQDLGGGYTLQPMQTPADRRADRAEVRADRSDARAERQINLSEGRASQEFDYRQSRDQRTDRTEQARLRREFNGRPEVAAYRETDNAFRTMRAAIQNPSSGGDIALIFSFMKVLDPTSTVREGEFATAQNSGSAFERVGNLANRVASGERLNPRQRQDFLQQAETIRQAREQRFNQIRGDFEGEARIIGADPTSIVGSSAPPSSGQTRRLRFEASPQQSAASQRIVASRQGGPEPARGTTGNPILINPADPRGSYGNVRAGQYYLDPTGQLRQRR